ncbi:MAG: PilZ domain-containing protein [Candidatus Omnitrophota bacterium]
MTDSQDKRKFLRTNKALAIEYREETQEENKSNRTFLLDISVGGGCIITYRDYKPGSILNLRIGIPSTPGHWVDIKGQVIKSDHDSGYKYSTRIQFLDLTLEQKTIIQEFVRLAQAIKDLKK